MLFFWDAGFFWGVRGHFLLSGGAFGSMVSYMSNQPTGWW
ncbi:hypothetical protein CDCE8392_2172 [Corynebacterium diphtheriae CDCE 8392]|nr:hypothetical protein CDPW8_2245 [Corynebacterium diphtheriae PW8]AEX73155.1 hypothetical protein CDCE8392_2172 [Corynebacterium diphtheriae CDCE 8392]